MSKAPIQGKRGEYWVVMIHKSRWEVVWVEDTKVYPCGDEQGWPIEAVTSWLRRIRL